MRRTSLFVRKNPIPGLGFTYWR